MVGTEQRPILSLVPGSTGTPVFYASSGTVTATADQASCPGTWLLEALTEINRITARTRPESLIKHLLTDSGEWDKILVVLLHSDAAVLAKVNLKQRLGTH